MMVEAQRWILERVTVTVDGCWIWKRRTTRDGYGLVKIFGRTRLAHRAAYEIWCGDIPDDLHLDHLCHNRDESCVGGRSCPHRRCVNPDHLEAVPKILNDLRGKSFAAVNAAKDSCVHGHAFDEGNTYYLLLKSGRIRRQCRRCQAAAVARYVSRKKSREAA